MQWLMEIHLSNHARRRPPRPLSLVQDLVINAGFLCGFIREQPLEAQFRLCQVVQFEDVGRGKLGTAVFDNKGCCVPRACSHSGGEEV